MAFRQLFERPQSWAEQQEQYVRERPCWGQQMPKDYATDVSLACQATTSRGSAFDAAAATAIAAAD